MKKSFMWLFAFTWGVNAMAQVGINTASPNPSSILDIRATDKGILIPQVHLLSLADQTTITNGNVKSLLVYNTNNELGEGYCYWDGSLWRRLANKEDLNITVKNGLTKNDNEIILGGNLDRPTKLTTSSQNTLSLSGLNKINTQQNTETVLILTDTDVVKAAKATMPKFFYMPSILIPTHADQVVTGEVFGTINLYQKYRMQFSSPLKKNSQATTSLPVLEKEDLDYFITWYDTNIFENVTVSNDGILYYTINPESDKSIGAFMNIVFAVKP